MMTKKEIGDLGETKAAEFLESKGCRIVCRNYHCRYGEIDIIAQTDEYILFVEVKTRARNGFGTPAEAVDRKKQKKLIITAYDFLGKNPKELQPRFDVAEVVTPSSGDFASCEINYIKNAFTLEGIDGLF